MSRTTKRNETVRVPSPIRHYVSFSGERGTFSYWDGESKERVDLGSNLEFVIMDTRSSVVGWNDAANARIYSNRVKSVVKEELTVRCGDTILGKGMYADIKEKVKAEGGKYATQVFALMLINDEYQPVQIDLSGAALGCWMKFVDELGGPWALYAFKITTSLGEKKKKGRVEFFEVNFATAELDADLNEQANNFNDDSLQPYLNAGVAEPAATVV